MGRTTVASDQVVGDVAQAGDREVVNPYGTGWRGFLTSWTWGAILAVACIAGLIAIFSTHPFASKSVSERVSNALGHPAVCAKAGVMSVAGDHASVYKCHVGSGRRSAARCFVLAGEDVRQVSGDRRLGC